MQTANHDRTDLPEIVNGVINAYFIFDVADTIDLARLQSTEQTSFSPVQLELHPASSPAFIRFASPPLSTTLTDVHVGQWIISRRAKIFDYGTMSVRLSLQYSGDWSGLEALSRTLRQSAELITCAQETFGEVKRRIEGVSGS